jgi:hypothetical protein
MIAEHQPAQLRWQKRYRLPPERPFADIATSEQERQMLLAVQQLEPVRRVDKLFASGLNDRARYLISFQPLVLTSFHRRALIEQLILQVPLNQQSSELPSWYPSAHHPRITLDGQAHWGPVARPLGQALARGDLVTTVALAADWAAQPHRWDIRTCLSSLPSTDQPIGWQL